MSNEADRLRHPLRLNVGKHQRKASRLHNLQFFSTPPTSSQLRIRGSCNCDEGNWATKIVAEKITLTFPIFSTTIFVTQFSPSRSQDPQIRVIASSSNSFEDFKLSKLLMWGNWGTKITDEKIENVSLIFSVTIFVTQPHTPSSPPTPNRNHCRTLDE